MSSNIAPGLGPFSSRENTGAPGPATWHYRETMPGHRSSRSQNETKLARRRIGRFHVNDANRVVVA